MCEHCYTVATEPVAGFLTLWPFEELGDDLSQALKRSGSEGGRVAHGFGLIASNGETVRLDSADIDAARRAAFLATARGPVDIVEAVAMDREDRVVFKRRERLRVVKSEGAPYVGARVHADGSIYKAGKNPRNPEEFEAEIESLANDLSITDRNFVFPALVGYVAGLARNNWEKMTARQIEQAFAKADRAFLAAVKSRAARAAPTWANKVSLSGISVGKRAFSSVQTEWFPTIGTSWDQPYNAAIKRIGAQGGWWLRGESFARSERLTAHGRKIVERGLEQGFGRDQIAADLEAQLGSMWGDRSHNYARVNAAAALGRARSFGEVKSYMAAGIEWLIIRAVIDERTTEICAFLDGQVISASQCNEINEAAANVERPEDIKTVNPWMREWRDPKSGDRMIGTRNGATFGKVITPFSYSRDAGFKGGQYQYSKMGTQFADDGVGTPPYHPLCRSWTEPRGDIVQVPPGFQLAALAGRMSRTIPARTARPVTGARTPVAPIKTPTAANRPVLGARSELDRIDPTGRLLEMDPGAPLALARGETAAFTSFGANTAQSAWATVRRWQVLHVDPDLVETQAVAAQADALVGFRAEVRDRVINLWTRALGAVAGLKSIVISEIRSGGTDRVWQVYDHKLKRKRFFRFNAAVRPVSATANKLAKASDKEAREILEGLRADGYLIESSSPAGVFGSIAGDTDEAGKPL